MSSVDTTSSSILPSDGSLEDHAQAVVARASTHPNPSDLVSLVLDRYDRNLNANDAAYVDLDNPASTLFKHTTVPLDEYEHSFEFKPSPWPVNPWVHSAHEAFLNRPGISDVEFDVTEFFQSVFGRPDGWTGSVYTADTAPLFQYAASLVSNTSVPMCPDTDRTANPLQPDVTDVERRVIAAAHDQTREILSTVYGETVPVFRGLSPSKVNPTAAYPTRVSDRLAAAHDAGEPCDHHHHVLESWTLDPGYAARYAKGRRPSEASGVLLAQDIPVDAIVASSSTMFALNQYESEVIVAHEPSTTYAPTEIYPGEDLTNRDLIELALESFSSLNVEIPALT